MVWKIGKTIPCQEGDFLPFGNLRASSFQFDKGVLPGWLRFVQVSGGIGCQRGRGYMKKILTLVAISLLLGGCIPGGPGSGLFGSRGDRVPANRMNRMVVVGQADTAGEDAAGSRWTENGSEMDAGPAVEEDSVVQKQSSSKEVLASDAADEKAVKQSASQKTSSAKSAKAKKVAVQKDANTVKAELDAFARTQIAKNNNALKNNKQHVTVSRVQGGYTAAYVEDDLDSIETELHTEDDSYIGHIIYLEKSYACTAATAAKAKAGPFEVVKMRRLREILRYDTTKGWIY